MSLRPGTSSYVGQLAHNLLTNAPGRDLIGRTTRMDSLAKYLLRVSAGMPQHEPERPGHDSGSCVRKDVGVQVPPRPRSSGEGH